MAIWRCVLLARRQDGWRFKCLFRPVRALRPRPMLAKEQEKMSRSGKKYQMKIGSSRMWVQAITHLSWISTDLSVRGSLLECWHNSFQRIAEVRHHRSRQVERPLSGRHSGSKWFSKKRSSKAIRPAEIPLLSTTCPFTYSCFKPSSHPLLFPPLPPSSPPPRACPLPPIPAVFPAIHPAISKLLSGFWPAAAPLRGLFFCASSNSFFISGSTGILY